MSVWFVIPSKRPRDEVNACLVAWRDMGFYTAVLREHADGGAIADRQYDTACYQGWARSTNLLIANVMAFDPQAEWFVGGGDDYYPDPNKRADEIATECESYFAKVHAGADAAPGVALSVKSIKAALNGIADRTFGVMQPTGDRWSDRQGRIIERIAGSPWMGREFCRRMYQGAGPMFNGYYHNYADEELQLVAQKLGVFWQRRDLNQEHRHWARPRGDWRDAPEWAHAINNPAQSDWDKSKALFAARKAAGFPGHEPLEI